MVSPGRHTGASLTASHSAKGRESRLYSTKTDQGQRNRNSVAAEQPPHESWRQALCRRQRASDVNFGRRSQSCSSRQHVPSLAGRCRGKLYFRWTDSRIGMDSRHQENPYANRQEVSQQTQQLYFHTCAAGQQNSLQPDPGAPGRTLDSTRWFCCTSLQQFLIQQTTLNMFAKIITLVSCLTAYVLGRLFKLKRSQIAFAVACASCPNVRT